MRKIIKLLIILLVVIFLIYILFGVILFINQKKIIYYPTKQNFNDCSYFNEYEKKNENNTRFYFKKGDTNDVIVYYHGNAGSACDRGRNKSFFEQTGASVIFVEYAGYSNDNAKSSYKLILEDVENIHNYIEKENYDKVLVYGQSLGTGAASYHAFLGDVDYLILVTPFSSMYDLAKSQYKIYPISMLLTEKYDNILWLHNYRGKLTIIHGDNDSVISHIFSQKLFDEISTKNKKYILLKNAGHNGLWRLNDFKNNIVNQLNNL